MTNILLTENVSKEGANMERIVVKDAKYGFDLVFKKTVQFGWTVTFSGVDWEDQAQADYVNDMTIPWPKKAIEEEAS